MRCVNCQLRIARLRRYRLSEESDQTVERLRRWVYPREITGEDYICHSCWVLINHTPNEGPQHETQQQFGHRNICTGCGRSILRTRSRQVLHPDMSEKEIQIGNIISEWIRPRQLTLSDKICIPCHLRAKRVVNSSNSSSALAPTTISRQISSQQTELEVEVKVEADASTSGYPFDETSDERLLLRRTADTVECDEVSPLTSTFPLQETSFSEQITLPTLRRTADTVECDEVIPSTSTHSLQETSFSEQITLPTLRRAADTARRCLFLECNIKDKRRVPDGLRKRIIKDYNFFIPTNARICNFHLGSNLFHKLYAAENAISTFSAAHVEAIVFLLSEDT